MNGNHLHTTRSPHQARRGSVMGLMAVLLPVLAILAAFCVNMAHVQLNRTELMVATDGQPLQLRTDDSANEMEFGLTTQPGGLTGRYHFQKIPTADVASGSQVASAFRVHGQRTTGSLSGRVPLIIPGILNTTGFDVQQFSVAMQVDRDISLVLDRSGSMENITFNWPSGVSPWNNTVKNAAVSAGIMSWSKKNGYRYTSGNNDVTFQQWAWEDYFGLGPAPQRPWDDLVTAVNAFLDVLDVTSQEEQVSVASYSSTATLDCLLQKNHQIVRDTVDGLVTGGATAIGEGMQQAITALLTADARPYAAKTMVVMTDGIHNDGIAPETVTTTLMGSYKLTIHTVTFGAGADQVRMQNVAAIGGGKHYHAATGAELVAIFEEIANNLPTILTQ
jgi:Ca-activated chloride channel homolog